MRLLVVNPNTSQGVTDRIDAAATAAAYPGDSIVTVSAASGPRLIVTDADGRAATVGVLQAIAAHSDPIDGIVLASFGDTGADAVRAAHPDLPVIGIAQAACAETRRLGGLFSVVTFAPELVPALRRMTHKHGVADALLEIVSVPMALCHDPADVAEILSDALRALCMDCAARGAGSIVLGGGPLAGLAARIERDCPVPVIDGTQVAIRQLRARIEAGRSPRSATTEKRT